jgi:outer membrane beta-barrel protein
MHRRFCGLLAAMAAIAASVWPCVSQAQDTGSLVVIQQRKFRLVHELELGASFAPLDAFTKGLGPELAYTLHFTDELGWEIIRAGYLFGLDTGLRSQLSSEFGVAPTTFETLQYYASSSVIWSPLYGKLASNNARITHVEVFFTLGPAVGRFSSSYGYGPEIGIGFRTFLNQYISWRLEARDAYLFGSSAPEVFWVMTGFSLNLGGGN